MHTSDRVLAQRYSKAFFQFVSEKKEEDKACRELAEAYKIIRDRMNVFKHPVLGAVRQKAMLKSAVGAAVSARTSRFLELLIEKKRFDLLPLIVADAGRILDERKSLVRAEVRSAAALTEKDQESLRQKLKNFSGKDVSLEIKIAPELLGGVVIKMGDWILDGSIQGKLRQMRRRFVEA